jgi:hypothetical protein
MGAAFVAAAVLAAVTLAVYGTSARATNTALMVTARLSFLLFWLAYAGGGIAVILGALPAAGARGGISAVGQFLKLHGREFGLAFASAHLVHVGLVGWLVWIGAPPGRNLFVFFVPPLLIVYLLVLFSLPVLQRRLGRRLWATLRTAGMTYIAYAFAADFLVDPFSHDVKHLIEYSPFAIMSVAGPLLHLLALASPLWRKREARRAMVGAVTTYRLSGNRPS